MPLPTARDTSYAAGVPVESADLNNLQDAVVSAAHGYKTKKVRVSQGYRIDSGVAGIASGDFETISSSTEEIRIPVNLPEGAILNELTVYGENIGAPGGTVPDVNLDALNMEDYAGGASPSAPSVTKNPPTTTGAWSVAFTSADTGIPYTPGDPDVVQIQIVGQAATNTIRVYGLTYEYYLPI